MSICDKYIKNPSRTVDATERTRFSKSRPNDREDIGQGQGSSHATHPLMLLTICTKYEYGKNPSWTVDATGRTRKVNGQTGRRTDRRTDRQTGRVNSIYPLTSLRRCKNLFDKISIQDQDNAFYSGKRIFVWSYHLQNGGHFCFSLSMLYSDYKQSGNLPSASYKIHCFVRISDDEFTIDHYWCETTNAMALLVQSLLSLYTETHIPWPVKKSQLR